VFAADAGSYGESNLNHCNEKEFTVNTKSQFHPKGSSSVVHGLPMILVKRNEKGLSQSSHAQRPPHERLRSNRQYVK